VFFGDNLPTTYALTMRKSAKKQQSQVQTIQRTVTCKNVTEDNGNINNFWKASRWFCRQCLKTFCYFLRPESRKWLFGKIHLWLSILTQTSRLPIDQVFFHSLHSLPVAVLTISANSSARANRTKSAKLIVDPRVFFQTRSYLHWRCV